LDLEGLSKFGGVLKKFMETAGVFYGRNPMRPISEPAARPPRGSLLAVAAAAVFLQHCASPAPDPESAAQPTVVCYGANRCAGMSQCATNASECGAHNDCRGKGWDYVSRAECERIGGRELKKGEPYF
jgi:uncharacterized membrane protein